MLFRSRARLCVVDPEHSVFFDHFRGAVPLPPSRPSRIEGIGRPRVEPSFCAPVIDRMLRVPDADSMAALRWLEDVLGRRVGASTGTALFGAAVLVDEMVRRGESGSVVALIGDGGERYASTCYSDAWLRAEGLDIAPGLAALAHFAECGTLPAPFTTANDSD